MYMKSGAVSKVIKEAVGTVLRQLRVRKKLSLEDVAVICKNSEVGGATISGPWLSRIETGQVAQHDLTVLQVLAGVYGTKLSAVVAAAEGCDLRGAEALSVVEQRWLVAYRKLPTSARETAVKVVERMAAFEGKD